MIITLTRVFSRKNENGDIKYCEQPITVNTSANIDIEKRCHIPSYDHLVTPISIGISCFTKDGVSNYTEMYVKETPKKIKEKIENKR